MTSNVIAFRTHSDPAPLRRPATLIRAARAGQAGWKRNRDLPRLLHQDSCPPAGLALPRLRAQEAVMNDLRLKKASGYDMQRHVLMMIAILAEMRAAADQNPARLAKDKRSNPAATTRRPSARETEIQARL